MNRRNSKLGLKPYMYVLKDDRGRPRRSGPAEGSRWFERTHGITTKVNPRMRKSLMRYFANTVDVLMEEDSAEMRLPKL